MHEFLPLLSGEFYPFKSHEQVKKIFLRKCWAVLEEEIEINLNFYCTVVSGNDSSPIPVSTNILPINEKSFLLVEPFKWKDL